MHVIRHDAPGVQDVTFTVEVAKSFRNDSAVLPQDAGAAAFVQEMIETYGKGFVETYAFGIGYDRPQHVRTFEHQVSCNLSWERVAQAERDGIDRIVDFPVRKTSA